MKVIFILSLFLAGAFCFSLQQHLMKDLFQQWKSLHKKSYKAGFEDEHRFAIFTQNYLKIQEFNQMQSDVVLALNQFADLTTEEFRTLYTGYNRGGNRKNAILTQPIGDVNDLPEKFDWREKGAVNPVKNQGQCGSCWAFSAVGALEGLYFLVKGKLVSFSEQQLVDCIDTPFSQGCDGGEMTDGFDHVAKNGLETGDDYPYTARTEKCKFDSKKAIKINNAYVNVTAQSAVALKTAIIKNPVSVAVQADQFVFQFYKVGVIKALCGDDLNHGIVAVGYDIINGNEAFIVKNSWGSSWGANGYVYISTDEKANNGNGVCGILMENCYPTKFF